VLAELLKRGARAANIKRPLARCKHGSFARTLGHGAGFTCNQLAGECSIGRFAKIPLAFCRTRSGLPKQAQMDVTPDQIKKAGPVLTI